MTVSDKNIRRSIVAATAVWTLWLGLALAPPILYDDAAINLRYAERLAAGRGFTYNDDERICGTSSPLWTLAIAGAARAVPSTPLGTGPSTAPGLDVERTARALTLVSLAAAVALASAVAMRLAGLPAAIAAGIILPSDVVLRTQALSGLELALAIALGLAAVLAAERRREGLTGLFLGLALWTKLDAAALAVAVFAAWRLVYGRYPKRALLTAAAVALPWFLFAIVYFGSPLPQSLVAKLQHGRQDASDPLWVIRFFLVDRRYVLAIAAACLAIALRGATPERRFAAIALAGWLTIHGVVFSAVSLGDAYPWYLGVPMALSIVLACGALQPRRGLAAVASLAIAVAALPQLRETWLRLAGDRPPQVWEAFDADRRLAGIALDQFAARDEVVRSGHGWVAFESRRRFVDDSGLNSIVMRPADYVVVHGEPWQTGSHAPEAPPGYVPLATFDLASRLYPGTSWFTVFGRPSSAMARAGRNESSVDVSRLNNEALAKAWTSRHGTR